MKISFKIVLACLCAANSMNSFSQQYFRASANGGISTIQYSADEISSKLIDPSSIGGGVTAEYIMFFNQYIGASAGVGVSMSQSKYELNSILNTTLPYYFIEEQKSKEFTYNAKFQDWEEKQMVHTIDIPVGAVGKMSFTDKITALAGLGVKFQLPIKATYKVSEEGTRTTTGYYKETGATINDLPHLGFYTLEGAQEGSLNTKSVAFAAYLDLGVQHEIAGQQFYYGIYGQYGFTQVNSVAENAFLIQYGAYDSPLNTTAIEKSRLLSFGIKIGYVLPLKSEGEEVETTEDENQQPGIKPERDEHPYTTVDSDPANESLESTKETVEDTSSVNEEQPAKKQNIFKRIAGKFKKAEENKE